MQQPNWGWRRFIVEVSRLHTVRHTHFVGLLWTSVQSITETATYTAHSKHKTNIRVMQSEGFELRIPEIRLLQIYALGSMATGIVTEGMEEPWIWRLA